jgi:phage tail-like protein
MRPAEILALLPEVYQRAATPGSPLAALVEALVALLDPVEERLDGLEAAFDPCRAEPRFVVLLAHWVDVAALLEPPHRVAAGGPEALPELATGLGRLRELVAQAHELSRWRGTAHGLQRFLTVVFGEHGFEVQENPPDAAGRPRPFHLRVSAPAALLPERRLLERILTREKPAAVTSELVFREGE